MHRAADPAGTGSSARAGGRPIGPGPASRPADHRPGRPVEGRGVLLRDRAGATRLCATVVVSKDLPTSQAGCSAVSVPTTGVDPGWLSHTTTVGQAFSDPVRVEGTYRDGTVAVSLVGPRGPDAPRAEPRIPCPAPPGGWRPGHGLGTPEQDWQRLTPLIDEVRGKPDRYTDIWEGHPAGRPPGEDPRAVKVMVVGTTGDVARARAELAAIFAGNLCVHPVRYSATDLAAIAGRLAAVASMPIQAEPDVILDKVRVRVVALDPATVAVLDQVGRDALLVEPLLRWLAQDPAGSGQRAPGSRRTAADGGQP